MNKVLLVALLVVVGGGLIAGLLVVGGPGYARMEKNDRERVQTLRALGEYYRCQLTEEAEAVSTTRCSQRAFQRSQNDPVTGEPLAFTMLDANRFEVCATFETDISDKRGYGFDRVQAEGQTGCVRYSRTEEGTGWRIQ